MPVTRKKTSRQTKASVPPHLAARIKTLQDRLGKTDIDALLITNPKDIRYLTGFVGDDSWALVPIRSRSAKPWVLTDFRFESQIAHEAPHARAIIRKETLPKALVNLLDKQGYGKIGLQPNHITLALQQQLNKTLSSKRTKIVQDQLLEQRSVKDAVEIKTIRQAVLIQQNAFERTRAFIEPGMTEQEIAAFLDYQMRVLGAEGSSFPTIVAADANAALPHAIPGKTRIKKNSLILIDFGASFQGYCSDLTRCLMLGKTKKKLREIYNIVLEAQAAAIDAVQPGMKYADLDAVARNIITKAGYGPQFGHSLGHGIGLDIHEFPTLSTRAKGKLLPGQIVTIEPGIYLPGIGGVRIEDDVLVTEKGGKLLSDLPKSFDSAII